MSPAVLYGLLPRLGAVLHGVLVMGVVMGSAERPACYGCLVVLNGLLTSVSALFASRIYA